MTAPDRPTRAETARSIANRIDWTPTYLANFGERAAIVEQVLRLAQHESAAQVRDLRAALAAVDVAAAAIYRCDQSGHPVVPCSRCEVVASAPQPTERARGGCGDRMEPWAGNPPRYCDLPTGHDGWHEAQGTRWSFDPDRRFSRAAPQPAVPDGEDRHEVECPSCGATIRARMADAAGGEGVPARLDAAAAALGALDAYGLRALARQFASALRGADDEHRAAVAAALARPTGGEP